jgi:predicted lactoylglutathione lyase
MKITGFNPLILTKDAAAARALFEALGFEKRHEITINSNGKDITTVRMKNEGGFYVDISQVDGLPQDMTLIRMNVDDFAEAYEFFKSKGFTNPSGDKTVDTRTNKSAMMRSPSGFAFDLCQHIKE